jgi:hypothetical protein
MWYVIGGLIVFAVLDGFLVWFNGGVRKIPKELLLKEEEQEYDLKDYSSEEDNVEHL